jgi:hypothetical protein
MLVAQGRFGMSHGGGTCATCIGGASSDGEVHASFSAHAALAMGVAVCCALAVRLFLGGVWCGERGDLLGARCTPSLAPPPAEVWRLLRSLVGRGRR